MKLKKIFFCPAICAMIVLATSCSSKKDNEAAVSQKDSTEIASAATEAPAVIVLAEGATVDFAQGKPVIIDFNATWCGPCKAFAPTFDEVAAQFAGKALFYSVDVDLHPELAAEYGVTSIPHIQFINPGDTAANTSVLGLQTKEDFTAQVEAFLK